MSVFSIYALRINAGKDTIIISQIKAQSLDNAFNRFATGGSGVVDKTFGAIMESKPKFNFTTPNLATAIAACGINGRAFDATNPLEAYFKKRLESAIWDTTNHKSIQMKSGILVPQQLTLAQGQEATVEYMAHVALELDGSPSAFDAENSPFVIAAVADAALPAIASPEEFTLGPVKWGSLPIEDVSEVSVQFNITVREEMVDGRVWPKAVYIVERAPVITLTTLDLSVADPGHANYLGKEYVASSGRHALFNGGTTDLVFYARRKDNYGGNVADGTASHAQFTVSQLDFQINTIDGQDGQDSMAKISFYPQHDGTNAIIVPAFSQAIS